jgi:hypothetical protein
LQNAGPQTQNTAAAAKVRVAAEAAKRRDEALWQAEIARLDTQDRGKGKPAEDAKPRPPVLIPPLHLRFDEGYWKAELSRVADTDGETLQKQKRTGLDKLAPPMQPAKTAERKPRAHEAKPPPKRDLEAEQALFEEEMDRLGDFDGFEIRRAKTD